MKSESLRIDARTLGAERQDGGHASPTGHGARRSLGTLATRCFHLLALAALLWTGWANDARAQASVERGEIYGFFVIPFLEVPDDPEVVVLAELLLKGQMVFAPSGAVHLNAVEVTDIEWSRVHGENYRYRLVDLQMRITDGGNAKGHTVANGEVSVTLLRLDRSTSQPLAMVTGAGRLHVQVDLRTDHMTQVENMTWTVSPLP